MTDGKDQFLLTAEERKRLHVVKSILEGTIGSFQEYCTGSVCSIEHFSPTSMCFWGWEHDG